MVKRIVVAGLLGGLVMIGWTFVINGIFGFRVAIDMNRIDNERFVYQVLRHNITTPGRYVFNPEMTDAGFQAGEPVYSVLYGGVGHEAAGWLAVMMLSVAFIAPMIGAWMLSLTSRRILSSYPRKVLFFTAIGLLIGTFAHLIDFGIGGYPVFSALVLFAHEIALWTAVGLVVAWHLRPPETARVG